MAVLGALFKSLPILILIVYSFLGAAILWALERGHPDCGWDFWSALHFVNTIHTSIGYGYMIPCSGWGKLVTLFYALMGVPLLLVCLDILGDLMASGANFIWNKLCCGQKAAEEKRMPFWVGILLTVVWVFLSALFFFDSEDWLYLNAVYFMFISISMVGFGDYYPTKMPLVVVHFVFITIGLALFAMVANLVQGGVEKAVEDSNKALKKLHGEAQVNGEKMSEENADKEVNRVLKEQGGMYQHLMGDATKERFVDMYRKAANLQKQDTQTDGIYEEPVSESVSTQTDFPDSEEESDIEEEVDFPEKEDESVVEEETELPESEEESEIEEVVLPPAPVKTAARPRPSRRKPLKSKPPPFFSTFPKMTVFSELPSLYEMEYKQKKAEKNKEGKAKNEPKQKSPLFYTAVKSGGEFTKVPSLYELEQEEDKKHKIDSPDEEQRYWVYDSDEEGMTTPPVPK